MNDPNSHILWERDSGGTPSDSTGPYQGDGPSQFYMYLEATGGQAGNYGRCINIGYKYYILIVVVILRDSLYILLTYLFRIIPNKISIRLS